MKRNPTDEQARETSELDAFLSHTGGGGNFGGFLGKWKDDGRIDLWLHPRGLPRWVWSHRWFMIGRDKKTGDDRIRFLRFNSYEDESIIRKRFARRRDGTLEVPPVACPFAKTLEWVWQAIESGAIGIADEVFRIGMDDGDADDEGKILHAGGFCGYFSRKDLDERQKKQIRSAGVRLNDAWMENCQPTLQYIFRVVVDDRPEDGCLIALEKQALGDKLKKVINDRQEDVGKEKGDPFKYPYAFRWAFDERKQFSDKYDVKAITSLELTDELKEVFEQEPPSVDELLKMSDLTELRMSFEQFWCHDVIPPWDELFADAERMYGREKGSGDAGSFAFGANREKPRAAQERPMASKAHRPPVEASEDDDFPASYGKPAASKEAVKSSSGEDPSREKVLCDACDAPMWADENICKKCGAEYDDAGNLVEKAEPPPPPRRRGKVSK